MKIRKGDKVRVLTGKDKGKEGEVMFAFPAKNTVIVEGVNLMKKHQRPLGEGNPGGICLLYTSPSPRDRQKSRMPSSA